jgi:hypothetical protein
MLAKIGVLFSVKPLFSCGLYNKLLAVAQTVRLGLLKVANQVTFCKLSDFLNLGASKFLTTCFLNLRVTPLFSKLLTEVQILKILLQDNL